MKSEQLQPFGLNKPLANAYILLLQQGTLTPPELAKTNNETRTNAYALLDKLVELGLATKQKAATKATYSAESPVALQRLMQKQRDDAEQREHQVKNALPELMNLYFIGTEQPGIRYFSGKQGLRDIYMDQVHTKEELYWIRTTADIPFFGQDNLHQLRNLFPKHGIRRHVITPDHIAHELPLKDRFPIKESDRQMLLERTWMTTEDYTAPVEWAVYGNKLSIISYGREAIGMIIDSPQIAEAFKQLFSLLNEGLKRRPDYHELPKKSIYTARPQTVTDKKEKGPSI